ncbi:hypothetical protein ACQ1Z3_14600, partial [Enterococcus faecalis]
VETKTASADGVLELRSSVGHTVMSDVTIGNATAGTEAAAAADKVEAPASSETRAAETTDAAKPSEDAKPAEATEAPKDSTTQADKPADKVES